MKVLRPLLGFFVILISYRADAQLLLKEYENIISKSRPVYSAEVEFDAEKNSYRGSQTINFVYPLSSNKGLILRLMANTGSATDMNMELISVRLDKEPLKFKYLNNTTVLIEGGFKPQKSYAIQIEFKAELPVISEEETDIFLTSLSNLLGLGENNISGNNYGVFGCSKDVCNLASIIPTLAKVYDDNWSIKNTDGLGDYQRGDFSSFTLDVIRSEDILFVCNGIATASEKKGKKLRTRYVADSVNDIVCGASSEFNSIRNDVNGILFVSYYIGEANKESAEKALKIASEAVSFFSKYYAKYPYSELKIVQSPITGGAGGVEFPAFVTIGSFLYGDISKSGLSDSELYVSKDIMDEMFEFVIVHEVAHQWFSTLVPSDSRKEPYLDEGLASYSAYVYFENKYGGAKGEDILMTQIRLNYIMMRLLGLEDLPISTPIEKYKNMFQYAGIVYGKAPLFFVKLRELIGANRFRFLLSSWTRERAFKDSYLRQLINMLKLNEPAKASQIESVYKRWIEGAFGDEDIGKGDLKDLLKYISGGKDLDLDISIDKLRDWLEETFEMFRQYR